MARSFRPAPKTADQFDGSSFFHEFSREWFRMSRRDGIPYVRRWQIAADGSETNVLEERVDYVIGAGDQAISYLHRTRDNKLIELPVSWYRENGGHWGISPAYDRPDHPGFSRENNFACVQCHTAYPTAATNGLPGETVFPAEMPEAIDCQRCHGPGQNHVDAASAGKSAEAIRAAIVNPAKLSAERRKEVCLQCHLETTSGRLPAFLFRPGAQHLFWYRPGESLRRFRSRARSRSARAIPLSSSARLTGWRGPPATRATANHLNARTATTRIVPFRARKPLRKSNALCVSCHTPHNSQNDCVSCHMPAVESSGRDPRLHHRSLDLEAALLA